MCFQAYHVINPEHHPKFSGLGRLWVFLIFLIFFTDPLAFNELNTEGGEDCDIEQHITIIPNPRAKRRGSMADHAFPELHGSRAGKKARVHIVYISFALYLTSDRRIISICFFTVLE